MAKLHKFRPAPTARREGEEGHNTWLGVKIDTVRAKFNKKHGDKTSVASQEENNFPRTRLVLTSLSGFFRGKSARVSEGKRIPNLPELAAVQNHQAPESSTSPRPSDFDQLLIESTISDNILDTSDRSIIPDITLETPNEAAVQVPQIPAESNAGTGSCSSSHTSTETEKIVHEALRQNDLDCKHILDSKTQQHAEELESQSTCIPVGQQDNCGCHFMRLSIDENVDFSVADNGPHRKSVSRPNETNACPPFSHQQHSKLVKLAVDQNNAQWECVMEFKREEHARHIEQLQEDIEVLQDERLRQEKIHIAKTRLEITAKDSVHARQLKAKDALAVGIGQIWQHQFDQQNGLLQEVKEENEVLKRESERLQIALCDETAEAGKYIRLLHMSCQVANETFLQMDNDFRQLQLHNAELSTHYNEIAAKVEDLIQNHVDLSQRHVNLAADLSRESAERQRLAAHNVELEEKLHQTRVGSKTVRQHRAQKISKIPTSTASFCGSPRPRETARSIHNGLDEESHGPWNGHTTSPFMAVQTPSPTTPSSSRPSSSPHAFPIDFSFNNLSHVGEQQPYRYESHNQGAKENELKQHDNPPWKSRLFEPQSHNSPTANWGTTPSPAEQGIPHESEAPAPNTTDPTVTESTCPQESSSPLQSPKYPFPQTSSPPPLSSSPLHNSEDDNASLPHPPTAGAGLPPTPSEPPTQKPKSRFTEFFKDQQKREE